MKIIPLQPLEKGLFTVVDDDIFELLRNIRWIAHKSSKRTRVDAALHRRIRGTPKKYFVKMARVITNAPSNLQVDHINRNPLDNRRENLRLATNAQNQHNRKLNINNKSGFKGVSYQQQHTTKPWRAFIQIDEKKTHVGYFRTPEEAARAYDDAAIEHYGEYALTNKSLGLL